MTLSTVPAPWALSMLLAPTILLQPPAAAPSLGEATQAAPTDPTKSPAANDSDAPNGPASDESNPRDPRPPVNVTRQAHDVLASGMLLDGHNDLPWAMREKGGSSFDQLDIAQRQEKLHTDIPRLRAGGVKAQFWSVYVPAETALTGDALLKTLEQIDLVHRMVKRYPDVFEIAHTADDVERIAKAGRIASMMGVEGGHSIRGSLSVLRRFHDLGVRYMTLTHSKTIDWADSATDEPKSGGLSEFGEDVVREMNRIGMLVDLSHVSVETMNDALRVSRAPIIFSHSSTRELTDHPRNVPDSVLRKLPENGGVIMITFVPKYITPTAVLKQNPKARGSVHDVADHIEHAIQVAGVDHVGIGSDFDGIKSTPVELTDVSTYPVLVQELLNRGHSPEEIHKILGGNVLRVLRQAEKVAAQMQREHE